MSTLTHSIAFYANTQANTAMVQATEAKKVACESFEQTFEPKTATVQMKREYSECIDLLYPQELNAADILTLKVVLLIAFVGMIVGAFTGAKEDVPTSLFLGFTGFVFTPIIIGIMLGIGYAALWLVGVV